MCSPLKYSHISAFDIPGAWFQTLEAIWYHGDNYRVGYGSESTMTRIIGKSLIAVHLQARGGGPTVAGSHPPGLKG